MTERPKLLKVAVSVGALLMSVHLCLASDARRSLSVNMEAWHDRFCLLCGGPDYFTWDDELAAALFAVALIYTTWRLYKGGEK